MNWTDQETLYAGDEFDLDVRLTVSHQNVALPDANDPQKQSGYTASCNPCSNEPSCESCDTCTYYCPLC
jgi:predicted component of type VI protein secretion system